MGQYEVVYIGGPRHGEREAREGDVFGAPSVLTFPTRVMVGLGEFETGEAVYRAQPMADTPGAIAYVHEAA